MAANDMDALLVKSKDPSSLLPDELSYIIAAFVPTQPISSRSKAYLILSAFCQGIRVSKSSERNQSGDGPDQGTLALFRIFQPLIASHLSQSGEDDLLVAVTFHSALFQVDWKSAAQIFTEDGFLDLLTTLETNTSSPVSLALARLYAQASSHKTCRQIFPEETNTWLKTKSSQTTEDALRAAAILAIVKLGHGSSDDAAAVSIGTTAATSMIVPEDTAHAAQLSDMVMNGNVIGTCLDDVVEGLAYLSVNSSVKKKLANSTFLKQLFYFVPKRKAATDATNNSTLIYGVLVIIANLCAYKPRLNQEQQQIAKLRRMAESGKRGKQDAEEPLDPLESEREVQVRCRSAISCGALDVLATASGLDSQGIRSSVGQVLLSLAENKENRGEILRGGGSKTLTCIIQSASSSSSSSDLFPQEALPAVQALAKLAITAPPIQVFGPNEGNVLDAVRPFSQLLLHPSSSMLQQFEAIMALTNIASHGPNLASRVANTPHLLSKVELLMVEDHILMRRAATELICNLVAGSEQVFQKYAGTSDEQARSTSRDGSSKSKIHILVAMSDVDDLPTRLAASGALAMLTGTQSACEAIFDLQVERHRAFLVLAQLIDPTVHTGNDEEDFNAGAGDLGLVHRGVVCIRNLLSNLETPSHRDKLQEEVRKAGLLVVFDKLLKGELGSLTEVVLVPAAEVKRKLTALDHEDDPSFLALSARLRHRTDGAFDSAASSGTSEHSHGGFIVEGPESEAEAGGFIVEDLPQNPSGTQSYIPLSEIPHALDLLNLSADDDVMGVFKNAAKGWGAKDARNDGVSRKDWRAVCAALLEGEDVDMNDEENSVGNEDVEIGADSGPDSDEYQTEELSSDTDSEEASGDEYEESNTRVNKTRKVSARTRTKSSGTEISRQSLLTESQRAQCRQEFSRFFPGAPDDELDQKRIMIKDIVRVADLLKENLKTEEILEMLEVFSTSLDKSMNLSDFEHMMVLTKLV